MLLMLCGSTPKLGARQGRGRRRLGAGNAVEGVGRKRVQDEVAGRREKPDGVLLDRTADRAFDVVQLGDTVTGLEAAVDQVGPDVVALKTLVLKAHEHAAGDDVAAVARDHVQANAAARDVGGRAAGGVDHLLAHRAVEVALHRAVHVDAVHQQPVDLHRRLRSAGAVRRHVGLLHRLRAADVRLVQADAGDQLPHALNRAAGGNGIERLAREHLRLRRTLHVDDRRGAGDGQRLFEAADLQLGVHGHGEVGGQLESLALHRREALQREGEDVGAGTQIHQAVASGLVGDDGARFFNQSGAGGFDCHTRQDSSGRVSDDTGERALCVGRRRPESTERKDPRNDP